MRWCAAILASYPETQACAQEELSDAAPSWAAAASHSSPISYNLPYIHAMVKRILRWRPSVLPSVPHVSVSDDWYEGVFIPRGTLVILNIWQCNHDLVLYDPDAVHFDPARFLEKTGGLVPGPATRVGMGTWLKYGYGRRACVGEYVANDSLFVDMATLLWARRLESL
ncbi:cytochrome P450 [Gloeopeniophorella convolvens]|nr:cytochrome P450 [Gloeopeniophorella convolvens]